MTKGANDLAEQVADLERLGKEREKERETSTDNDNDNDTQRSPTSVDEGLALQA